MSEQQPKRVVSEDEFIAQALALEEERVHCFAELADSLEAHHNAPAADLLHELAAQIEADSAALDALASSRKLTEPAPWECLWAQHDSLQLRLQSAHYLMGESEALVLAMHSHKMAIAFHQQVLDQHPAASAWPSAIAFVSLHQQRLSELQQRLQLQPQEPPAKVDLDPPNMPE